MDQQAAEHAIDWRASGSWACGKIADEAARRFQRVVLMSMGNAGPRGIQFFPRDLRPDGSIVFEGPTSNASTGPLTFLWIRRDAFEIDPWSRARCSETWERRDQRAREWRIGKIDIPWLGIQTIAWQPDRWIISLPGIDAIVEPVAIYPSMGKPPGLAWDHEAARLIAERSWCWSGS